MGLPSATPRSSRTSSGTAARPSDCPGSWAACPTTSWGSPATAWPRPPTRRALDRAADRAARVIVQGLGAVGGTAAERLDELGGRVVAVSTAAGAVHDPAGLDVPGSAARRGRDDWSTSTASRRAAPRRSAHAPADVLVPAAMRTSSTPTSPAHQPRLVVEGANLPITPPAREVLRGRGVPVVPGLHRQRRWRDRRRLLDGRAVLAVHRRPREPVLEISDQTARQRRSRRWTRRARRNSPTPPPSPR